MEKGGPNRIPRWLPLLEAAGVFLLIMLYIWWLQTRFPPFVVAIFALVVASHRYHKETLATLGFGRVNLRRCAAVLAVPVLSLALVLLTVGATVGTIRSISPLQGTLFLFSYFPWGLFQQYVLNGYFLNRLRASLPGSRGAPLLAALLFATAHAPNWFLMGVTLVAGYVCALLYTRYRNLYVLGLAHGAIGFLIYLVVPDSITHHMFVGPRYWRASAT
jgi:membrane protease YdiL (CAAX protease family)